MKNEKITKAIEKLRSILCDEIRKRLIELGGVTSLEADCRWVDNDGEIYGSIVTKVFLDCDNEIFIGTDEDYEDHIELYSIDEIIKIVDAL